MNMPSRPHQPRNRLRAFHEDEAGLEAIQVVMIVAIAAIILAFVWMNWGRIKSWASGVLNKVTGWNE